MNVSPSVRRAGRALPYLIALIACAAGSPLPARNEFLQNKEPDGNRTPAVHRIDLLDAQGQKIALGDALSLPFSTRRTCGECHNYESIAHGLHFNAGTTGTLADGRPGEPWMLTDLYTGTQLPVSRRDWKGAWRPEQIGMTAPEFVKAFGSHHPGGNLGEAAGRAPGDDGEWNWDLSGDLEINCLACHNRAAHQDQNEWAAQIARGSFGWAAAAASGLGLVRGAVSKLPQTFSLYDGLSWRDPDWKPLQVEYHPAFFDSRNKAIFDIPSRPTSERCLFCHSHLTTGEEKWESDGDVHLAAGMACVDCHRNGMDHAMTRGYDGELADRAGADAHVAATLSCEGCHLGSEAAEGHAGLAGRLGAPIPAHAGIPLIHFEKMTCTACHSGPWPEDEARWTRTARSHRLGVHTGPKRSEDFPFLVANVFLRQADGRLAPHNMVWPAFWGRLDGGAVTPLLPEALAATATGILDAEQQVDRLLAVMEVALTTLADEGPLGKPALLLGDRLYRRGLSHLEVADYAGTMTAIAPAWVREFNGELIPIAPAMPADATADTLDVELGLWIGGVLKAIYYFNKEKPFEPVLATPGQVWRRTDEDALEMVAMKTPLEKGAQWMWRRGDELRPLAPDFVLAAVAETVGAPTLLTEEQVRLHLQALDAATSGATHAYVSAGRLHRLDAAGKLVAEDHEAARPYAWPVAHDVRGAGQSLGARACEDCHANDAPFYFSRVAAIGPLVTKDSPVYEMKDLMGDDVEVYIRTSQFFKWLIIVTMTLLILHICGDLLRRFTKSRAA